MKKLSLFALLFSLGIACQNNAPEEEINATTSASSESLKKEVMDLHDKIMPEMTPMSKLQGQLQAAAVGSPDSLNYMTAAQDLKFAKQAMMEWMRGFSSTFNDDMTEAEKVSFLETEKVKMMRIDSLTQVAINNAQEMYTAIPVAQDSL
ncbi:MAG: hypothetical protein DA405_13415 [Bacteroidetes bacterium]|nr:MAG: hypothetical protein DA405_13415 [Bacteroidota bacterium]